MSESAEKRGCYLADRSETDDRDIVGLRCVRRQDGRLSSDDEMVPSNGDSLADIPIANAYKTTRSHEFIGGPLMRAVIFSIAILILASTNPAAAQLHAAKEGPVAIGHHHLNVSDVAAHKKFWVDQLGAKVARLGPLEVLELPNLILILREHEPEGSNRPSTVNHIGLQVRDLESLVLSLKSAGFPIVTQEQIPAAPRRLDAHP